MENLSISDPPQQGGPPPALGAQARPPQQQQQLPAQMFTTAAQLLDLTDSKRLEHASRREAVVGYEAAGLTSE